MKLSKLLKNICVIPDECDREISGLSLDSRKVKAGDLFLAIKGYKVDGRDFIDDAVAKGAVAVLVDGMEDDQVDGQVLGMEVPGSHALAHSRCAGPGMTVLKKKYRASFAGSDTVVRPYICPKENVCQVEHLGSIIGEIAARFYEYPSRELDVIGITGTNGKTSCAHFIAQILESAGVRCGVLGTAGCGFLENLDVRERTTGDAVTLQEDFADLLRGEAKAVSMEVSSHALVQGRCVGTKIKYAVFTNLTPEHLDYHGTMEEYAASKELLLQMEGIKYAAINIDDEVGVGFAKKYKNKLKVITFSLHDKNADVYASNVVLSASGISATINSPWGRAEITIDLWGRFNLSNVLAAVSVVGLYGISWNDIICSAQKLHGVPGRMQSFKNNFSPLVVIDYAHTIDALSKLLSNLQEHQQGEMITVFGCGGERDRTKRAPMGGIAEKYSSKIILTDDNPRGEDSLAIIEEIKQGIFDKSKVIVESSRACAIDRAFEIAKKDDIIVLAGKGHEDYQIVGDNKIPFSDIEYVKNKLNKM
ncbi:MAG: UDP-N-acetylmuramoyl-L-alanyl-D-glutamate--2,6-diaminopimelate ligase [Gammaproteobacteria bacterium]|nr:UDP-N-acetylmuramoyl-L-alanyl-D-glutamate--2,6-diaminopimelate ligase [Gammaproteobacteria bacterium]